MARIIKSTDNKAVSNLLNRDSAQKILHVLAAPKSNHIEIFPGRVLVSVKDLKGLIEQVGIKLNQLHIDVSKSVMKTIISFDQGRTFQLVGWNQIEEFNWSIAEKTKSILIRWEFMYQGEEAQTELHVLNVTINESVDPMQMLRAAFSRDREDMEGIIVKSAPVVCEVDYYDGLLSRELVQIVAQWHKALRKPVSLTGIGQIIQEKQSLIMRVVLYSLELLTPLAYVAGVYLWMSKHFENNLTTTYLSLCVIFIMVFFFVTKITERFSQWFCRWLDKNIDRMGRLPIFEMTSGDHNKQTKAFARVQASTYKFWGGVILAFAINVASTIFAYYALHIK